MFPCRLFANLESSVRCEHGRAIGVGVTSQPLVEKLLRYARLSCQIRTDDLSRFGTFACRRHSLEVGIRVRLCTRHWTVTFARIANELPDADGSKIHCAKRMRATGIQLRQRSRIAYRKILDLIHFLCDLNSFLYRIQKDNYIVEKDIYLV
jgi:hypothetical protein